MYMIRCTCMTILNQLYNIIQLYSQKSFRKFELRVPIYIEK